MRWQRELREFMLAGGTVALGSCALTGSGCSSNQQSGVQGVCCNANPDPCCPSTYCGASKTAECNAEEACQADGGMYDPFAGTCSHGEDGSADVGRFGTGDAEADASATDAKTDAATTDAGADDGSAPDGHD
jgi:hypothetical protein